MLDAGIEALLVLLIPERMAFLAVGTVLGLTVGLIPGLAGMVGMSLMLPFIYGMDPVTGIALLMGFAAVTHTGDTFPSVLIGVPGSAGSQATVMDGYPLAKMGQAARALGAGFFASLVGGLIGAIALLAIINVARPVVLALGSPELLALSILGLSMVGVLSSTSPLRGLAAGAIGLMIGSIGAAPAAPTYRYTFDTLYLLDGVPLPIVALGLFAIPEMVSLLSRGTPISASGKLEGSVLTGIRDVIGQKRLVLQSSLVGVGVGIIPGLGGAVVDWLAYGIAKQTVNNPKFGEGDIRGVIAPESANNAKEGGALVPTLLFGIPGSGTTAVLLGALVLLGIQPGPRMLDADLGITLTIIWTLAIANVFATTACLALVRPISRISLVPGRELFLFLIPLLFVAAYQSSRNIGDFAAFLAIGFLGWALSVSGWPRPPVLIGFVLAPSVERYLHLTISIYSDDWMRRPIALGIGAATILILLSGSALSAAARRAGRLPLTGASL